MREYPKIESLYNRDEKTFKFKVGEWRLPEFEYLANNEWVFTEKIDGTNIRVMWDGSCVTFGGRTDNAQTPTFLLKRLQELFPPPKLAAMLNGPGCLYGEGFGSRIQKGGGNYNPSGVDFILFDVLMGEWWLKRIDVEDVAAKLGIQAVPVIGRGTLLDATRMASGGFDSTFGKFPAEGLVIFPAEYLRNRAGHRIIAKLKQKDF